MPAATAGRPEVERQPIRRRHAEPILPRTQAPCGRGLCSLLLWAVLVLACAPDERGTGPLSSGPEPPRHVILITVDTLRADHLGHYGYPRATSPFLDSLAARGVVFERAIAQWPKTGASFASMFLSRYPQTTGLTHKAALRIPGTYTLLPELLQEAGFTTLAVVSNPVLSPELDWHRGFDEYLTTWNATRSEEPAELRKEYAASRVNELALPLIERHSASERVFLWLHYSDPHAPYILPDGFSNPFLGDDQYQESGTVDLAAVDWRAIGKRRELEYYVAQYDANVLVSDTYIARMVDALQQNGLLEDALIVFSSDHGESLGEHDLYFEHGPLPYNTAAHVPLLFVREGQLEPGRRIAEAVELVDLFPTLGAWLFPDLDLPELEGENLLPLLFGERQTLADTVAFAESGRWPRHFRSAQNTAWKLIYRPAVEARPELERWELYFLSEDPLEENDLATTEMSTDREEVLRRMKGELRSWFRERPIQQPTEETVGGELRERLKALGYVQ